MNNHIRLICTTNGSNKFYELKQNGKKIITYYGIIGRAGNEYLESFYDDNHAKAKFDKKIKEKLKRGYIIDSIKENSKNIKKYKITIDELEQQGKCLFVENEQDREVYINYKIAKNQTWCGGRSYLEINLDILPICYYPSFNQYSSLYSIRNNCKNLLNTQIFLFKDVDFEKYTKPNLKDLLLNMIK